MISILNWAQQYSHMTQSYLLFLKIKRAWKYMTTTLKHCTWGWRNLSFNWSRTQCRFMNYFVAHWKWTKRKSLSGVDDDKRDASRCRQKQYYRLCNSIILAPPSNILDVMVMNLNIPSDLSVSILNRTGVWFGLVMWTSYNLNKRTKK